MAKKKKIAKKTKPVAKKKKVPKPKKKTGKKTVKKFKVVKKLKKIPIPKDLQPGEDFSNDAFFKAKIRVIGVGGGGASILSEIGKTLQKATFVIADTDTRVMKKRAGMKYFSFGSQLTHGLGTGMNPQLARQAAEQEKEKIKELSQGQNILILIASLGGGVGSGATQVFAEALKDFDGVSFGIFTLPFKFEGKAKYQIAIRSLAQLRKLLNVSITIPNENIFKIIHEDTPITQAFSTVNKQLIESLESLIDLIYNPGVINIDFADLKAILQGTGNLAFLNTAEAGGKNRLEEIVAKTLHNPLFRANNFPVQRILFNIQGGGNLSMFEVDKISRAIAEHHKDAKIIFGISKNSKYKNRIKATVLMTGPTSESSMAAPPPAPVKEKLTKPNVAAAKKIIKKKAAPKKVMKNKAVKAEPVTIPSQELPVLKVIPAEVPVRETVQRRSALEIKKERELEEQKKSKQEEEWEIPAFLRVKKN